MRDVYEARHWAVAGTAPGYHTPDEDVYLPGRNVILLGKAGVYCATAAIDRLKSALDDPAAAVPAAAPPPTPEGTGSTSATTG